MPLMDVEGGARKVGSEVYMRINMPWLAHSRQLIQAENS